jgi:hypothetical protein
LACIFIAMKNSEFKLNSRFPFCKRADNGKG